MCIYVYIIYFSIYTYVYMHIHVCTYMCMHTHMQLQSHVERIVGNLSKKALEVVLLHQESFSSMTPLAGYEVR